MAAIRHYSASISKEDTTEVIDVDMTDLPYGKFDATHQLVIKDDVVLANGKKKPLHSFANVIIQGIFDCSSYVITSETVLPTGITELKCLHSINSLADLIDILPSSVRKVVVRTAILNSIKKNTDNASEVAKSFVKKYPHVIVTDGKTLLSDILNEAESAKTIAPVNQKKVIIAPISVEKKTDEWLCTDELIVAYKQHESAVSDMSDDDIQRAIRIVKKRLNKRELMREDGAVVSCIHRDDVPALVIAINQQQKRDNIQKTRPIVEITKKTESKIEKTVAQPVAHKYFVGNKEVQETVIQKYIKNNVWKSICNHCKSDLDKKLAFLQAIEDINVRPVDTAGKQVCYVQDGMLKTSSTITFKNAQWLSQGFSTLDDRARIIWCMNEHGFIATEYFEEHEKKQSVDYKQAIRQKDVSGFTPSDAVCVSNLIKELTAERDEKMANVVMSVTAKSVPAPVPETVSIPEQPVKKTTGPASVKTESKKRSHPKKVRTYVTSANPVSDKNKNQVLESVAQPAQKPSVVYTELISVSAASAAATDGARYESIKWTDYESLHMSFAVKLQELNTTQSELLQKLLNEQNTDTALEYNHQLNDLLIAKKKCETVLAKLDALNQELQQIKQDFEKQM